MNLVRIKKIVGGRERECYINPEKIIQIEIMDRDNDDEKKFYLHLEDNILIVMSVSSYATMMSIITGGSPETWME